ncbi:Dynein light chain 2B, cytoplasmic, putative [Trichomonas vaginalis G3]|uniref:Dynein light chain roadblock n=1 Tax=Trichomonas vaginalis (strain ATCC PRA-98 / G3) TaxID=412133 RepID=A2EJE4_TRIV3|nr:dynein intermediate chain binding [Trichomonas vaginalis G3]EAY07201.1 Dynein light chain 2B, cytoplasmic, putative [Trichomonas vaginalis G3]KAI5533889.1 dynein intermediate chain binding [Trichomonas vaginalis G3]|eukprot:XP_001319424.1 Dynein light chain 2B, cytoplasmic [Trichomonas vaginalis G3]
MSDIIETLKRIEANKSVIGTLVLDAEYKVIHSAFKNSDPAKYAEKLPPLLERAASMVKDCDPDNSLTFLRIRTEKLEILISPTDEYTLIVVQNMVMIDS